MDPWRDLLDLRRAAVNARVSQINTNEPKRPLHGFEGPPHIDRVAVVEVVALSRSSDCPLALLTARSTYAADTPTACKLDCRGAADLND
jgi:hypothetical protein